MRSNGDGDEEPAQVPPCPQDRSLEGEERDFQSRWYYVPYTDDSNSEEESMARRVYHSSPTDNGWKVTISGRTISQHRTQGASEDKATAAGRKAEAQGHLGQAVLHKANGKIREERTYGADPRKRRG